MHRVANLSQFKNKRNDVITMQIIEFSTRDEIVEMFESRFANANVAMSQLIHDQLFDAIERDAKFANHELKFNFDQMHENIETCLHYQIALNYACATFDENDVAFALNEIARDSFANRSLFELIRVDTMQIIARFYVDRDLSIHKCN